MQAEAASKRHEGQTATLGREVAITFVGPTRRSVSDRVWIRRQCGQKTGLAFRRGGGREGSRNRRENSRIRYTPQRPQNRHIGASFVGRTVGRVACPMRPGLERTTVNWCSSHGGHPGEPLRSPILRLPSHPCNKQFPTTPIIRILRFGREMLPKYGKPSVPWANWIRFARRRKQLDRVGADPQPGLELRVRNRASLADRRTTCVGRGPGPAG
jgi:hypothetical protein